MPWAFICTLIQHTCVNSTTHFHKCSSISTTMTTLLNKLHLYSNTRVSSTTYSCYMHLYSNFSTKLTFTCTQNFLQHSLANPYSKLSTSPISSNTIQTSLQKHSPCSLSSQLTWATVGGRGDILLSSPLNT